MCVLIRRHSRLTAKLYFLESWLSMIRTFLINLWIIYPTTQPIQWLISPSLSRLLNLVNLNHQHYSHLYLEWTAHLDHQFTESNCIIWNLPNRFKRVNTIRNCAVCCTAPPPYLFCKLIIFITRAYDWTNLFADWMEFLYILMHTLICLQIDFKKGVGSHCSC